jgi:hypothetical protein
MHYYANGGPGPATKLLRVLAPDGCDEATWQRAPAERWTPEHGWFPITHAQLDIRCLGEFSLIDDDEVPDVQAQITARRMALD